MCLVMMMSYWIKVGPKFNDWCLYKRFRDRDTQRGDGHMKMIEGRN